MAYSCVALLSIYMLKLKPSLNMVFIGMANVPMYSMEVKFQVFDKLKIIIGEVGPVEGKKLV